MVEITQLKKRLGETELELTNTRDEKMKLMDEFERSYLARKLQQVIKLQVLAPRVSVTINKGVEIDVEVAPSKRDLE